MRKFLLSLFAICGSVMAFAESTDSCYVYKFTEVEADFKGFYLVEKTGDEQVAKNVVNSNGEKLRFTNWVTALNYLTREGWELMEIIFPTMPKIRENFNMNGMLLRKKMPEEEAKKFSTPLNNE